MQTKILSISEIKLPKKFVQHGGYFNERENS